MRRWYAAVASITLAACADQTPTGTTNLDLSLAAEDAGSTRLATRMLPELEFPVSTSLSKGHATIEVLPDGTIESVVHINNKSLESVRFGHIHWLPPGAQTGPIVWWLTSPVGLDLNMTDRTMIFRQTAIFVRSGATPPFATHEAALAELLLNPDSFYVNFHSDAFPGGFARGFLDEQGGGVDETDDS